LIVNADDFGLSGGVNAGIMAAHEHGIVTSASLMVRWPAARYAAGHPRMSLGLHLDLGEWAFTRFSLRTLLVFVTLCANPHSLSGTNFTLSSATTYDCLQLSPIGQRSGCWHAAVSFCREHHHPCFTT
jgi:hypothetical protein